MQYTSKVSLLFVSNTCKARIYNVGLQPNYNLKDNINTCSLDIQQDLHGQTTGQYHSTHVSSVIQDLPNMITTISTQQAFSMPKANTSVPQRIYDSDS